MLSALCYLRNSPGVLAPHAEFLFAARHSLERRNRKPQEVTLRNRAQRETLDQRGQNRQECPTPGQAGLVLRH
jgi:hypothetical protein